MTRVAVLGCGPAGLMVAHAAQLNGCNVSIFSKKERSPMGGAQYLHEPIPVISPAEPDGVVRYTKVGTAENYAKKVYGSGAVAYMDMSDLVSFLDVKDGEERPAWNLTTTYEALWMLYEEQVVDCHIGPVALEGLYDSYDYLINTIPRTYLCAMPDHHEFLSATILILIGRNARVIPDGTIAYNGDEADQWYRQSHLWGFKSTEYSGDMRAVAGNGNGASSILVRKPVAHSCTCWQEADRLLCVGRYGKWQKGVLTNHAFNEAYEWLRERV